MNGTTKKKLKVYEDRKKFVVKGHGKKKAEEEGALRLGQTGLAAGTNPLATLQVELAHLLKKRHT